MNRIGSWNPMSRTIDFHAPTETRHEPSAFVCLPYLGRIVPTMLEAPIRSLAPTPFLTVATPAPGSILVRGPANQQREIQSP